MEDQGKNFKRKVAEIRKLKIEISDLKINHKQAIGLKDETISKC